MKPLLALAACLMPAAALAGWTPPANPDPFVILREAKSDAEAGRHEDALAKHLWYHRHALEIRPSQAGVRLSFALSDWHELGEAYPPALDKLREVRDEAGKIVVEGKNLRASFQDYEAINKELGEAAKTKDAFVALHVKDPEAAAQVFDLARPSLIEAKQYELCGKYVDPKSIDRHIKAYHYDSRLIEEKKIDSRHRDFAEKKFTNEATTLVALLVVNARKADAEQVAAKTKAEWDSPAFDAAIDDALKGNVPEPWPSKSRKRR